MEFRGRDLLSAEARFLADYCGEDAVRRWHARLSDFERDQLSSTVFVVREICRSLAAAMWRLFQTTFETLTTLVRSLVESLVALIAGRSPGALGNEAP
jgi:hypothetical protein